MDFKLNEEQEEFRKLACDFGTRELSPAAESCDKNPTGAQSFYKKIFDSGLMNVQLSEDHGGLGLKLWDAALIAEGLAQGCSGISSAIEYSALSQLPFFIAATAEQQEKFLGSLNEKLSFGGISIDSLFGSSCSLKVTPDSSGYALKGRNNQVLNGSLADWFVVDAIDASKADDIRRLTFVVPRDAKNVNVEQKIFTIGRCAADICSVEFDGVVVTSSNCLINTQENEVSSVRSRIGNSARVLIAAGMTGVAQSAFEHAKKYANERLTFGKPIAQHQGIAFMMADMAKDIEAARELTWQAAILSDRGGTDCQSSLSAILFASEMVMRVTTDAVQVYGGYGYSKEYPVEKLMRDAKTYQCMIPSSHMLKSSLGRQLLAV